jgi:ribosomal protein S10
MSERQHAIMLAAATMVAAEMEQYHAVRKATTMADQVFGPEPISNLDYWRDQVMNAQSSYATLKRDHYDAVTAVRVIDIDADEVKAQAVARLVAKGATKTDAAKLLHQDEGYADWNTRYEQAVTERDRIERDLSIARNELYTNRLILASYLSIGDAASTMAIPARD